MARRVKTTTAKAGSSASDRRVLASVTGTTSAPTLATDGYLMQQNEVVHLLFAVGGTSPVFRVRIYLYSDISGRWHKSRQLVVNSDDVVTVEVNGLSRIMLVVETAPQGTNPSLDAWVALARPV